MRPTDTLLQWGIRLLSWKFKTEGGKMFRLVLFLMTSLLLLYAEAGITTFVIEAKAKGRHGVSIAQAYVPGVEGREIRISAHSSEVCGTKAVVLVPKKGQHELVNGDSKVIPSSCDGKTYRVTVDANLLLTIAEEK